MVPNPDFVDESADGCCGWRDHSPGPCACSGHLRSPMHPFGAQFVSTCGAHLGMRWVEEGVIAGHISVQCGLAPGHEGECEP